MKRHMRVGGERERNVQVLVTAQNYNEKRDNLAKSSFACPHMSRVQCREEQEKTMRKTIYESRTIPLIEL